MLDSTPCSLSHTRPAAGHTHTSSYMTQQQQQQPPSLHFAPSAVRTALGTVLLRRDVLGASVDARGLLSASEALKAFKRDHSQQSWEACLQLLHGSGDGVGGDGGGL